ncbi:sigma-70 family RNA polymerase sigma factor [Candidatus Ozemobacteraceae bacterium]|nr:sigma-70 family RNA polymerase sigma factor [Candidatus Ozemobacteraceae bacterium]
MTIAPNHSGPPDGELVREALRGSAHAFEALVSRHQQGVYRFLYHFMGNAADAEDITQETFLNIHRKLKSHNPAQSFTSWMITIARNLAISHHRRRTPSPLDPALLAAAIKDVTPTPESELLAKEAGEEVHAALQRLPEEIREVLIMRYLMDIPLQQVAEMLNIPEGTAKSRLFKARNVLREQMERNSPRVMQTQSA